VTLHQLQLFFAGERILERWIGNVGKEAVLAVTEGTEKTQ
jgi:hypothetical protein